MSMVTVQEQFAIFPKNNQIIATTYNFDYEAIRDLICPRRGVHERSIVLTDSSFFSKEVEEQDFFNQGLTHFVYPAQNVAGAFHPKVALGIEEGLVRLLIGSHNLTENGAKYNLELTGFYEFSLTENNSLILNEISTFLKGLTTCITSDVIARKSILQMSSYINDINPSGMKWKTDDQIYFLHSFEKPIIEQVIERIPEIKSATICVPTHSQDKDFIKEFSFSTDGNLKFLVDPKNHSIKEELKETYSKFKIEALEIEGNRNLHAKIYFFNTIKGVWTLYGSPNFTRPALMKSVKKGGNLEAAILLGPSKKWGHKQLFGTTVKTTSLSWYDLQPLEEPVEEEASVRLVENWGYETPNNEAVIFAPGLQTGDTVYVRLFGIGKLFEVIAKDGLLRFKLPGNWNIDSRYEVLNREMKVLVKGFLNRSGAIMSNLSNVDIDDESKIRLWFFVNRLRNFEPSRYDQVGGEIPLIPLDPGSWIDGLGRGSWSPVSGNLANLSPDQIFSLAKSNFDKVWDRYYDNKLEMPKNLKLRLVIIALDIYMEGAFYAHVVSGGANEYLVQLGKDLSEFFGLPCERDFRAVWNEEEWKTCYFEELNEELIETWNKIGSKIRLDVSLLFDFWLYFFSEAVGGFQAFNKRSLDVPINVKRFHQIFQALQILISQRKQDASFQKIWDDRSLFLEPKKQYQKPSSLKYLDECLENCNLLATKML
jgi:hypothetical protein